MPVCSRNRYGLYSYDSNSIFHCQLPVEYLELSNGVKIPQIGFGVYYRPYAAAPANGGLYQCMERA